MPNQRKNITFSSESESPLWELFHENSKLGRFSPALSDEEGRDYLNQLHESLLFEGFPVVPLPRRLPALNMSLGKAIMSRISARDMLPGSVRFQHLAALLHFGYGVNRSSMAVGFCRSFRVVPSAGALYPLEIFFHSTKVEGLSPGLYHYNPSKHHLRLLREGDQTDRIFRSLVDTTISHSASLLIFITAMFERSVFKYGDRGYRFSMLEAGHVAQNISLVSGALGLGCLAIGGFFDRELDAWLQLDGVTSSTIYVLAIGRATHDYTTNRNRSQRKT